MIQKDLILFHLDQRDNLISINVSGDVDYPGTYTLDSEATLADLYGLIGLRKLLFRFNNP